jgi:hypothetical protein
VAGGTYAEWFNRRHERSGHLFRGRFKLFIIDKETYSAESSPLRRAQPGAGEDRSQAGGVSLVELSGHGRAGLCTCLAGSAQAKEFVGSKEGGPLRRLVAWIAGRKGWRRSERSPRLCVCGAKDMYRV